MNALIPLLTRPLLYWFAVPFVVTLGLFLGISSASAEEARTLPPLATPTEIATAVPTRPGVTPPPTRPGMTPVPTRPVVARPLALAQALVGRIAAFDPRNQAIIVQTRADKYVTVVIQPATIARLGDVRIRLRDMQIGDAVTVLGKRTGTGTLNAALINIKPRLPAK